MDARGTALGLLCLAVLGVLCAEASFPPAPPGLRGPELDAALRDALPAPNTRSARATANQKWLHKVEEYARAKMGKSPIPLQPFRIDLPLADGGESLPVLVLPVPVYEGSCNSKDEPSENGLDVSGDLNRDGTPSRIVSTNFHVKPATPLFNPDDDSNDFVGPPSRPKNPFADDDKNDYVAAFPAPTTKPPKFLTDFRFGSSDTSDYVGPIMQQGQGGSSFSQLTPDYSPLPLFGPAPVSSDDLVTQFRLQQASAPSLPPALLPSSPPSAPSPAPLPSGELPRPPAGPTPPQPRWTRSLLVRGDVTVPRADYTEPYTVWWDATTGSSRVEMHGGSSASYIEQLPGTSGMYRLSAMSVDRSDGGSVRRCMVSDSQTPAPSDPAPPTLPDPQPFRFEGYTEVNSRQVEVWRHTTQETQSGEALTYRHQLIVTRTASGEALPLSYSVSVDSSILGASCDGWEHHYSEVQDYQPTTAELRHHLESGCDETQTIPIVDAEQHARLKPLREFTLPLRDERYTPALHKFMTDFQRVYADQKEEAVRKNIFIQHSRFVSSCNREGGTFEVAVNFLGDRLAAELDVLLGVVEEAGAERGRGERFPHGGGELQQLERELPEEFDWRSEGAVTHVRYQGSCSSCWAMAVAGAVEGALFVRTRRLVPLAEQCLVDCAHSHGAHGCGGTWPSHAYDYIKDRGLPALDEYGQHKEKVETCRDKQVPPVTHISAHVNVTRNSLPALKVAIKEHAPNVVIVDAKAKSFIFYKKGVLYDDRCGKQSPRLNHAVLAVGWGGAGAGAGAGAVAGAGAGGGEYVTIKNSWSAAWGEAGYARLQAPANTCGILALPSYPRLEDKDVDRRS